MDEWPRQIGTGPLAAKLAGRKGWRLALSKDEDILFERALRKELRRGVRGETDKIAENTWAQPADLGPEWSYAKAGKIGRAHV